MSSWSSKEKHAQKGHGAINGRLLLLWVRPRLLSEQKAALSQCKNKMESPARMLYYSINTSEPNKYLLAPGIGFCFINEAIQSPAIV